MRTLLSRRTPCSKSEVRSPGRVTTVTGKRSLPDCLVQLRINDGGVHNMARRLPKIRFSRENVIEARQDLLLSGN